MKIFAILLSIIVGILSVLLFKEHLLETASVLYSSISDSISSIISTTMTDSVPQEQQQSTSPAAANMSVPRAIRKAFLAVEQAEGAGARVRRSIGTPQLKNFSPFLMLDHFSVKPGAGFPDHPHRGQETITYMLSGAFDHEDFAGNKGTIHAGDLQFMTAGKGIVHSEMPAQNTDGSANTGLQLWVDLPVELKGCDPRYRDLRGSEIPAAEADDGKVSVKVISGRSHGVDSVQDLAYTPVWLLDITVKPGGRVVQPVPKGFNAFLYTLEGTALFGAEKKPVPQYHNVVFELEGDDIVAENSEGSETDARFVIVAGQVLDQPVVQYGPFVVTSIEEVQKALFDYSTHSGGFERADGWASEIGKSMAH
ncbi:RNA pol II transcription cofactor [Diaporthe australafricana]|uniref:RNA pol II transcription cofactor n=1 Tax=Diaporthe australafricana TaxID=127596 RepID=A0ABR3Y4L0_9PEZI